MIHHKRVLSHYKSLLFALFLCNTNTQTFSCRKKETDTSDWSWTSKSCHTCIIIYVCVFVCDWTL